MKITLLHYTAPPLVGGVETLLARLARQLTRAGHSVRVLAGRGSAWDARIPVETCALIDPRHPQVLRLKTALDAGEVPPEFAAQVTQLEGDLRRALEGSQVVMAHNVASLNKNLALTAALYNLSQQEGSPRLLLWHHDLAWSTERTLPELHPGWPWDLLRTAWPGARQVTVSEVRRQELAALLGLPLRQITVVPNGIDPLDFLGLPPDLAALAGQWGLALSTPVLLCPLRVTRRKNLELALETLAALRGRMPRAALLVTGSAAGQGAYLDHLLKRRAELGLDDCAHFLAEHLPDGLNEAALSACYRLADALLLTSREEGFGMPLLEAGLAGVPIFCSDLPPLRALAGENAVYFAPGDPAASVAALVAGRLGSSPVYRMKARVRREFTWEGMYHKLLAPLID